MGKLDRTQEHLNQNWLAVCEKRKSKQLIHWQFIGAKFATNAGLVLVHLYDKILGTLLISHICFSMNILEKQY